tara:strand:- start:253 stop:399 length:147 start_codon:yes stop_codon:yes gene_type:complete
VKRRSQISEDQTQHNVPLAKSPKGGGQGKENVLTILVENANAVVGTST